MSDSNARATVEIIVDEAIGKIPRQNYGMLLEAIGTSIYDGIWVGSDSQIPNINGIRRDVVEALRRIKASIIRWPGGSFASNYDWRDGIGPQTERPRRTSYWNDHFPAEASVGPHRYDPNQFGTDEFVQFCRLVGAEPFLNANTRSLPAQVFDRWIEYCNSPAGSTTLADARLRAGFEEPHNVRYWGLGNEVWGDLGQTVEEYLADYKRFASMVPKYDLDLRLIACGAPPGLSLEWLPKFISGINATLTNVPLHSISVHHYAGLPHNKFEPHETVRSAKLARGVVLPPAISNDVNGFYRMLAEYDAIDAHISAHWDIMRAVDPGRTIKLAVDEWGAICAKGTELSPENYWSRTVTLRDILGTAIGLDTFNRHCTKIELACFTGLINQEGGLFVTEGDQFVSTGIDHVFELYSCHQGAQSLKAYFNADSIAYEGEGIQQSLWGLNGSASLHGKTVNLTAVNPDVERTKEVSVRLRGATIKSADMTVISHEDIRAYNSFEAPEMLRPVKRKVGIEGDCVVCDLPAASVARVSFELA